MKICSKFCLIITVIIIQLTTAVSTAQVLDCIAPAKSLIAQVNDFCFLQFETDDIAHSGVQSCVSALSSIPDNCLNRTQLKAYRCNILLERRLLKEGMSVQGCVNALETEGLFARGCEYPFDEKCIKQVNKK